MTPVQLEVLLHHSHSPEPYPREAPAHVEALSYLLREALIMTRVDSQAPDCYDVTPRGRAYVEVLQRLPLPEKVQFWRVPAVELRWPE